MDNSVATVTTIKAPVWQTRAFMRYHLRIGIDHMFLYFDDPQDPSIPMARTTESVTCVPCDQARWSGHHMGEESPVQAKQRANATDAFECARESGFEWLVHIDGDELLHPGGSLSDLFMRSPSGADVLVFPTKEALPQRLAYDHPFRDISFFKYDPVGHILRGDLRSSYFDRKWRGLTARVWRHKKRFLKRMGYNHPGALDSFLLGHTNGKAATRTSSPVERIGNHRPRARSGHALSTYALQRGAVLHFDCMGYEPWRRKWASRLDGSAHFNTDRFRPDRRTMLDMFRSARQTGREEDLRALYERMYVLSASEQMVLRSLGFVERIRLPETLFAPIHSGSSGARSPERQEQLTQ